MRASRLLTVAVLFAALCAVPTGLAQVPSLPPLPIPTPTVLPASAAIEISGATDTLDLSVDGPAYLNLTVTSTADPTGVAPLDAQLTQQVTLMVSGLPDSFWTASITPSAFQLPPGATQTVQLKLTVQPSAAADAHIQVVGTATSPGSGSPAAADFKVEAHRSDGLTRTVLERIGPGVYALIAVIPLLVLVIVLLAVRNRPVAVRLDAPQRSVNVVPGGRGAIPVVVANPSRRAQTVLLRAPEGGDGWTILVPDPEVQVPARGAHQTQLVLVAPKDARVGDRRVVTLAAYPADDPRRPARIELDAVVEAKGTKTTGR